MSTSAVLLHHDVMLPILVSHKGVNTMAKDKGSIGFPSSSKYIDDAFNEANSLLDEQQRTWVEIKDEAAQYGRSLKGEFLGAAKSTMSREKIAMMQSHLDHLILVDHIARLGIETADLRKQVNRMDKAMKGLKLVIK